MDDLPDDPWETPLIDITQSSAAAKQNCDQQWFLRYKVGLVKRGMVMPFIVGNAVHNAMMTLFRGTGDLLSTANTNKCHRAIDAEFDKALEASDLTANLYENEFATGRAQAAALFDTWCIINSDELTLWHPVLTEVTVRGLPSSTMLSPRTNRLSMMSGKIDLVAVHKVKGLYIDDHKTKRSIQHVDFIASLPLSLQMMWYALLFDRLSEQEASKIKAVLKKLKLPNFTKGGNGLMGFHINAMAKPQHRLKTTSEELQGRMHAAILEDPEKYFYQGTIEVDKTMLDRAAEVFDRIILNMMDAEAGNTTMNFNACQRPMHSPCPYMALCKNPNVIPGDIDSLRDVPELNLYAIQAPNSELGDVEDD